MAAKDYAVYAGSDYSQSFAEMVDWSLARLKDPEKKNYFRMTGQDPVTYAEFARNVNRICNMMTSLGMKKGEHVAIYLPNCAEYAYLYHSLSKCGLVMVPLN